MLRVLPMGWLLGLLMGLTPPAMAAGTEPGSDGKRAEIAFRKDALPGFDGGRWALGVVGALGVGLGALWLLRRRLPGILPAGRERRIKLVETLRVSPRSTVIVVEVDGQMLVLGEHGGTLVLLSAPVQPSMNRGTPASLDRVGGGLGVPNPGAPRNE